MQVSYPIQLVMYLERLCVILVYCDWQMQIILHDLGTMCSDWRKIWFKSDSYFKCPNVIRLCSDWATLLTNCCNNDDGANTSYNMCCVWLPVIVTAAVVVIHSLELGLKTDEAVSFLLSQGTAAFNFFSSITWQLCTSNGTLIESNISIALAPCVVTV